MGVSTNLNIISVSIKEFILKKITIKVTFSSVFMPDYLVVSNICATYKSKPLRACNIQNNSKPYNNLQKKFNSFCRLLHLSIIILRYFI